jgi:DNA topoisomerase-1
MAYTLVICEKPSAAKTIANALADGEVRRQQKEGQRAVYYEFAIKRKKYITVPAVGHLLTLKAKRGSSYPTFDLEWVPSFTANKFAAFTKEYYDNIMSLVDGASDFIVATDFDTEGEVIGYNVLKFLCKQEDAKRMKFSTMTKEELEESFKKMTKHLEFGQVEAGLTRHYLDFYYGVNLSKALMAAIKTSGRRFRIMSTGRVQGPTLHMLVKHEKKIKAFKSTPFWQIAADMKVGKEILQAEYEKDKIWEKDSADKVLAKTKNAKTTLVKNIEKKQFTQKPPVPYNTTAFLADVYRYFGYSPQQAMSIAEALYQAGLISYPRTNSQQLPADINYKKIISDLAKQERYAKDAKSLLSSELKPNQGKATSAAHPAIYPTGQLPRKVGDLQAKVYDLVVRRFFAVFGKPAKRESQKVSLDINGEIFHLMGKRTVEAGWTSLYGRYAARDETLLPDIKIGDKFDVKKVVQIEKETQPPARYSQGSVLKEMEQRGLGTQSTRAGILQILYNRGYIVNKSIEVTELGMRLSDILEKNVPDIVSEKLTRHFEEECDHVDEGTIKRDVVIKEAQATLTKICEQFKKKEKRVGEELTKAIIEAQEKQNFLGTCPKCGGTLKIHKFWKTGSRFVGCTGYKAGCTFSSPLPRFGNITNIEKTCETCKAPMIQVHIPGKRPFRTCVDIRCESKKDWFDKKKLSVNPNQPAPEKPKKERKTKVKIKVQK